MKKIICLILGMCAAPAFAATQPVKVRLAGTDFVLPLQKVSGTQLYSFQDKKGYPGVETVVAGWNKDVDSNYRAQLTLGAAPVLGTSNNVPFAGFQVRLSDKFFDTKNNALMFGLWIGKESDKKNATWGVKASVPLW